jgi:hypothetical protein
MSLRYDVDDSTPKDDGLNLQNFGYAIVLITSYVMVALMIGSTLFK